MAREQRKVYQRQPARAVLLDMSPPMDSYTCLNVHEALTSTLCLVLQHQGAPSLSHLSITLLGNYPKCLFPMQPIRSNAQRVSAALKCLAQEAQCLVGSAPSSETCLLDGLQEVLAQFHRLSHNSKQALGSTPSQVEVTLVTGRREETVRERLTRASDHISLDQLRKICVVSMPV
ncbi:hypothetical protein GBAR_LOCUS13514 [Geodia barretti]|uniref:Uncharacterized protein n=1 Tax=Geodia barretti TaxID=519541 RepID=A0AA35WN76_GEOBA|nr:hypothetical protein GBAR_LOCUS13514 [Geodia barretti]